MSIYLFSNDAVCSVTSHDESTIYLKIGGNVEEKVHNYMHGMGMNEVHDE